MPTQMYMMALHISYTIYIVQLNDWYIDYKTTMDSDI